MFKLDNTMTIRIVTHYKNGITKVTHDKIKRSDFRKVIKDKRKNNRKVIISGNEITVWA